MSDVPQVLLGHHLKALKLPTFLREYDKLARQCAAEGVDHTGYLLRLSELELLDRERRLIERRIRQARFPAVKSLDSFDFAAIPSLNKLLVLELARCSYVVQRENVIALGNSGTGKTHVALGLGLAACQKGLSVGFTTAAALVHELLEARDEKRLLRLQKQLIGYQLLIVDELGYVPLSPSGAELLFEVIVDRHSFWVGSLRSRPTSDAGERCRRHSQHRPCRTRNALYSPRRTRSHSVSRDRCSTRITSLKPGRHATSGLEPSRRARSSASSRTQTRDADRR